jgi:hypothetical protein
MRLNAVYGLTVAGVALSDRFLSNVGLPAARYKTVHLEIASLNYACAAPEPQFVVSFGLKASCREAFLKMVKDDFARWNLLA